MLLAAETCAEQLNTGTAPWRAAAVPGFRFELPFAYARSVGRNWCLTRQGGRKRFSTAAGWRFRSRSSGCRARIPGQRNEFPPAPLLEPATLPPMLEAPVCGIPGGICRSPARPPVPSEESCPEEVSRWQALIDGGSLTVPPRSRVKALLVLDDYYCAQPEAVLSGGARLLRFRSAGARDSSTRMSRCTAPRGIAGIGKIVISPVFTTILSRMGRSGGSFSRSTTGRAGLSPSRSETAEAPLRIDPAASRENRIPVEFLSRFEGGGEEFRQCARLARRTLEMCSHDTFMDCPYYEQLMYVGDTRIQALITRPPAGIPGWWKRR